MASIRIRDAASPPSKLVLPRLVHKSVHKPDRDRSPSVLQVQFRDAPTFCSVATGMLLLGGRNSSVRRMSRVLDGRDRRGRLLYSLLYSTVRSAGRPPRDWVCRNDWTENMSRWARN